MNYAITSIMFSDKYTSDSARRLLKRLGINPSGQGGRRQDGWLQYPIIEETSTDPKTREDVSLGNLRLRIGILKS